MALTGTRPCVESRPRPGHDDRGGGAGSAASRESASPIRILIADDHEIVSRGAAQPVQRRARAQDRCGSTRRRGSAAASRRAVPARRGASWTWSCPWWMASRPLGGCARSRRGRGSRCSPASPETAKSRMLSGAGATRLRPQATCCGRTPRRDPQRPRGAPLAASRGQQRRLIRQRFSRPRRLKHSSS